MGDMCTGPGEVKLKISLPGSGFPYEPVKKTFEQKITYTQNIRMRIRGRGRKFSTLPGRPLSGLAERDPMILIIWIPATAIKKETHTF
jgi:hypothetical protein